MKNLLSFFDIFNIGKSVHAFTLDKGTVSNGSVDEIASEGAHDVHILPIDYKYDYEHSFKPLEEVDAADIVSFLSDFF